MAVILADRVWTVVVSCEGEAHRGSWDKVSICRPKVSLDRQYSSPQRACAMCDVRAPWSNRDLCNAVLFGLHDEVVRSMRLLRV